MTDNYQNLKAFDQNFDTYIPFVWNTKKKNCRTDHILTTSQRNFKLCFETLFTTNHFAIHQF